MAVHHRDDTASVVDIETAERQHAVVGWDGLNVEDMACSKTCLGLLSLAHCLHPNYPSNLLTNSLPTFWMLYHWISCPLICLSIC